MIKGDSSELIGEEVVHKKTGHHYEVLYIGRIEKTLELCVVYAAIDKDGFPFDDKENVWVRPLSEFCDGRFELCDGLEAGEDNIVES